MPGGRTRSTSLDSPTIPTLEGEITFGRRSPLIGILSPSQKHSLHLSLAAAAREADAAAERVSGDDLPPDTGAETTPGTSNRVRRRSQRTMGDTNDLLTTLIEYTRSTRNRDTLFKTVDRIPEFDGEHPPLNEVIRKIRDGFTLIDEEEEPEYVRLVITRLVGAARTSVEGKTFETIVQLVDHLKKRYAPGRDPASYLAELGRLQIQDRESLANYIGRTSSIVNKARAAIRSTYRNSDENIVQMEKTALDNFLRGLPDRIYYAVAPKAPESLDAAYDLVIDEDRARRNRRQAMGGYRDYDRSDSPGRSHPRNHDRGRRDNVVMTTTEDSTTSSGADHRRRSSRYDFSPTALARVFSAGMKVLSNNPSRSPSRERSPSVDRSAPCLYCKRSGHAIEFCRTLMRKQREVQDPSYRPFPREPVRRDSSASSTGSLNYEGGRHDVDPAKDTKNVRFEDVGRREAQAELKPSAILRRPQPRESGSERQNWRRVRDNSP